MLYIEIFGIGLRERGILKGFGRRLLRYKSRLLSFVRVLFLFLWVETDTSVDITVGVLAEAIIVTRKDSIQDDTYQRGDCERSQSDGCAAYGKGETAGEAETANEDDCSDDQIP